jgi:hypothetical protein
VLDFLAVYILREKRLIYPAKFVDAVSPTTATKAKTE